MSENPFHRLAPFLQEYIYSHNWTELRDVQIEACRAIFHTDDHLLLAAGTASGKTEAAFLPVLTLLFERPPQSVGVLYIGPLKALINDQFVRLNELLKEVDIPVYHWHGDVSRSSKSKLLHKPQGVLQITPESLESLLLNKAPQIPQLFGDLQFVVIDEVHVFMSSDRGRQILCQLQRLSQVAHVEPRRIGLSATLGDFLGAEQWLRAGTSRQVITPKVQPGQQKIRLSVQYFPPTSSPDAGLTTIVDHSVNSQTYAPPDHGFGDFLFDVTGARKCLIFSNSRSDAESAASTLRSYAEVRGTPDIYHVHHGSISASLREAAEEAMRDPTRPAVTAATCSLELGIDIGQLERVIQLDAPSSVSSFVQRLGRSGRRGQPSELWFACRDPAPRSTDPIPRQIPWGLLQMIAEIQLYIEDRWIEPILQTRYPLSLLYHQTMSTLAACGELSPAALADRILKLHPFRHISQADYKELLLHLIAMDHIHRMEEGGLILGLAGEAIVRDFRFYAVFADNPEFAVFEDSVQIGTIVSPPPVGERFGLAGRTWEVIEIDAKRTTLQAKRVKGKVETFWRGGAGTIHERILERMHQVLVERKDYPFLSPSASTRLDEARQLAQTCGLVQSNYIYLGGDEFAVFPWTGSAAFRTLERCLQYLPLEGVTVRGVRGLSPYFLTLRAAGVSANDLQKAVESLSLRALSADDLIPPEESPQMEKFDEFIPSGLLRKAFASDRLDVLQLQRLLRARQ